MCEISLTTLNNFTLRLNIGRKITFYNQNIAVCNGSDVLFVKFCGLGGVTRKRSEWSDAHCKFLISYFQQNLLRGLGWIVPST